MLGTVLSILQLPCGMGLQIWKPRVQGFKESDTFTLLICGRAGIKTGYLASS